VEEHQSSESEGFLEGLYNSGWSDRPQSPEQEQEEADGPGQGGSETELEQSEGDADAVENQPGAPCALEALCTCDLVDSLGWLDGEDLGGAGFTYASGGEERSEVEGAAQEGGEVEEEEGGPEGQDAKRARREAGAGPAVEPAATASEAAASAGAAVAGPAVEPAATASEAAASAGATGSHTRRKVRSNRRSVEESGRWFISL
jgi:hypothetical protein